MTEIYRNDMIYSISYALDYVEHDLVMIAPHHSKRVALLSSRIGATMQMKTEELLNLAICGALHDNALTEYMQIKSAEGHPADPDTFVSDLGLHCRIGENNISRLSFYPAVRGAILYHHENADGSGPFRMRSDETPVSARLIHIADSIDSQFDLSVMSSEKFDKVHDFVKRNIGFLYDRKIAEAFAATFSTSEKMSLDLGTLDRSLRTELPEVKTDYTPQELIKLADFFAKIIDYKSHFTYYHSSRVARNAARMAEYYGWDEDRQAQLYLAGALHDIGKMMVRSEVLEKPAKLTEEEFEEIKQHAYGSYKVLSPIRGISEVAKWAYDHHEKLNGRGYPFGKDAGELGTGERLMACLDIYQALREDRPYRMGMDHEAAMKILLEMAQTGDVDAVIVTDMDKCFRDDAYIHSF